MRKFLIRIMIYTAVLAAIVLTVNACSISILTTGVNVPENIQICNFGSSHGHEGYNYEDFAERYVCSNFGLSSQSLAYDYRILQFYRDKLLPDAVVFITMSYFSLFGKPEVQGEDFISKNKRYYKFLPQELIMQYDLMTDIYVNYFPCLSPEGLAMLVKNIFSRKKAVNLFRDNFNPNDEGWDRVTTPQDAAIDAPKAYGRHIVPQFDSSGRRIRRQEAFEALYGMIDLCHELGARPILVTVPYTHDYTDYIRKNDPEFFTDFYAVIDEIRHNTGIEYHDYAFDERFRNDYSLFINSDHLNRKGARLFTNTLMHEVLGLEVN